MIHIRTDNNPLNKDAEFACGVSPLPPGDKYFFAEENYMADCPKCNPNPRKLGTPISELSGRIGDEKFKAIARSYGYD